MNNRALMGLIFLFVAAIVAAMITEWVSDNVLKL